MDNNDIAIAIKRNLRWLTIATVVLYLALGTIAITNYARSKDTNDALCALRADQERSAQASRDFLVENPKGIPGFSPTLIKQGIVNRERTVKSLSSLNC